MSDMHTQFIWGRDSIKLLGSCLCLFVSSKWDDIKMSMMSVKSHTEPIDEVTDMVWKLNNVILGFNEVVMAR